MPYKALINDHGYISKYKDTETGEVISAQEFERRQNGLTPMPQSSHPIPSMYALPPGKQGMYSGNALAPVFQYNQQQQHVHTQGFAPVATPGPAYGTSPPAARHGQAPHHTSAHTRHPAGGQAPAQIPGQQGPAETAVVIPTDDSPLVQPGAHMLNGQPPPAQATGNPLSPLVQPGARILHGKAAGGSFMSSLLDFWLPLIILPAIIMTIVAVAVRKRNLSRQKITTLPAGSDQGRTDS
jgi:hypothetical protein